MSDYRDGDEVVVDVDTNNDRSRKIQAPRVMIWKRKSGEYYATVNGLRVYLNSAKTLPEATTFVIAHLAEKIQELKQVETDFAQVKRLLQS
jgi:hypothetical protein